MTLLGSYAAQSLSPFTITNPEPGVVTNWTDVTNLHFASPNFSGIATEINGNAPTNRQSFGAVRLAGLTLKPGECVFFRWHDLNDSGSDQGLAVDDLTVEFSPEGPLIASVSVNPTNGFVELTGLGESNIIYGIEAATNLTAPILWQRLGTNAADASGVFQFTDTNAPAFSTRFYRVVSP